MKLLHPENLAQMTTLVEDFHPQTAQEKQDQISILADCRCFPDLLWRENTAVHFTASSWITNESHDKVLLCWHNLYRSWSWVGGHCDGDPDVLAVALREAQEETGLHTFKVLRETPISLERLPVQPHCRRGQPVDFHYHDNLTYLLEARESEPLQVNRDENQDLRWFSLADAVKASTEALMKSIYQKLNHRLQLL